MRKIKLGNTKITQDSKCYVIAKSSITGLDNAIKMIHAAKECGADAVKFQRRNNRKLFTKSFYDSPYNSENSFASTYGTHRDYLEMKDENYKVLIEYSNEIGIDFFATPFEEDSLEFFELLDLPFYKVASGDIFNLKLLKMYTEINKPIIISTGGCTIED